jgi:hypothetical protein
VIVAARLADINSARFGIATFPVYTQKYTIGASIAVVNHEHA